MLDKYNIACVKKNESESNRVFQMELIVNELYDTDNPFIDKCKLQPYSIVFTYLKKHIITSLVRSEKKITMTSFQVLLVLEEKMIKRRNRENGLSNLMIA